VGRSLNATVPVQVRARWRLPGQDPTGTPVQPATQHHNLTHQHGPEHDQRSRHDVTTHASLVGKHHRGEGYGEGKLHGVEGPEGQPPDPEPERHGDAGGPELSGVSRIEIAGTIPSQVNGAAVCTSVGCAPSWLVARARRLWVLRIWR
jgi:hypothetical protein